MKRLAVLVKNEKVDAVISSLRELNHDAIIYDVKSAGKEREQTHSGRYHAIRRIPSNCYALKISIVLV